ncbi:MAG: UDP-N-acetylmuramoyl-L-alanyl-D-glutamate--2,6-diaminopimelate ligase [Gammaproteobacteria bacterium]|nr:UDP-N-acetylmuramoyl-L-alanyl-D-glutamate--2,6-diaminopimelate ligase [Gammaproteobacteria bacterium]
MTVPVTYTQNLGALIAGMVASTYPVPEQTVSGLSLDSRSVESGWLFLSLAQNDEQRTAYLKQALDFGASVILFDVDVGLTPVEFKLIESAQAQAYPILDLAENASEIAARYYDFPSDKMTVIAVTGTNGKTSVSQFIAQSLDYLGFECGIIGTLGVGKIGNLSSTGMTTPDPILMQALFAEFYNQGCSHVVIEASSHALAQGRLNSVAIDSAILTNLSRDHLDYHNTMEAYALAKKQLFMFKGLATAILNTADAFGQSLIEDLAANQTVRVISYNAQTLDSSTLSATAIESHLSGMSFTISYQQQTAQIKSDLLGRFNVDNLLATVAGLVAIEVGFDQACQAIQQCHAVEGRMQAYSAQNQAEVVIDFAHTPDALTQALMSLRTHLPQQGVLWCVFGCGGDRDKGKRAVMGQCAELYADKIVLTTDNPRSENNHDIVADILMGITKPESVHIEHDRQQAITFAVVHASQDDIVLVAGKGHEDYQEIAGNKIRFSDAVAVVKALQAANDDNHSIAEVQ